MVQENLSKAIIILFLFGKKEWRSVSRPGHSAVRTCHGSVTQNNSVAWSSPNYFIGHILLTAEAKRICRSICSILCPIGYRKPIIVKCYCAVFRGKYSFLFILMSLMSRLYNIIPKKTIIKRTSIHSIVNGDCVVKCLRN